jgi:ADP-ribosylglycohydrolase
MLANNPSRFEILALACLVFSVVGDAMGTPTENLEPADIEQRFGWVESFEGDGTDCATELGDVGRSQFRFSALFLC